MCAVHAIAFKISLRTVRLIECNEIMCAGVSESPSAIGTLIHPRDRAHDWIADHEILAFARFDMHAAP